MPKPDFAFRRSTSVLAAITPRHARRVPDEPEQPDRRARCRSRRFGTIARRVPDGSGGVRRRGVRRILRDDVHPGAAGVSQRDRRPDVLEGLRPRRPAHRRLVGASEALDPMRCAIPVYSVNIAAVVAVQAALADRDYLAGLPAAGRRVEGAALRRLRSAGAQVLEERRELRAGPRRRSARRASSSGAARARHLPPRPLDRAGLRRLPAHRHRASSSTRAASSTRWRRSCAPRRNRSPNDGDADRADASRSTARAATTSAPASAFWITCSSCSRGTARSTCRSRPTAISTSISITPSRISASRSARRCRKALGDRRGINRAGYFVMPMDETLAVAAVDLGGRPHAVVDLKVGVARVGDLQTELVHDFFEGFAHRRPRQRARQGAVRPIEPSSRRGGVQGVRARAARRLREGQAAGADAAEHQGTAVIALIDYKAGNLTSVRKAFAAIGADVFTPAAPADLGEAAAIVVPGVGHFGATAALDRDWVEAILARVGEGRPLLGICLGMQWLFDGSEEAPELPGPRPARRHVLPAAIDSRTRRIKVPHVGWNSLAIAPATASDRRTASRRARRCTSRTASSRRSPATRVAVTEHGEPFASIVQRGHVAGVQFHPEKSGEVGLQILRNFLQHGRISRSVLSKRIIACLDVRDGQVVKGINFEGLRSAGDPAELARRYNREGIDELVILDITATHRAAARAGRHDPRRRARAVHPARRRRRHPDGSRRRGGGRGRRRQGQPEYRGAFESRRSSRRSPTDTAARRCSSRSTPSGTDDRLRGLRAQRPERRPIATRSSGRAKPKRAARARSC